MKKEYGKEKQGEGEKVEEECGGREWKLKNEKQPAVLDKCQSVWGCATL